jgi:hypothetical protein
VTETIHVSTNGGLFKEINGAGKRQALLCAMAGVLAVLAWQAATVHFNYGGNWSALFCTGDRKPVPPDLAAGTYVFPDTWGYDGQFYRYVACDPWFQKGWARYIDSPRVRYGRILVPATAWLLAGGNSARIDAAYFVTVLAAVFLGIFWLGCYAELHGRPAIWGLLFLLLPATLISVDRMTVDAAFAAACVGALYYARREAPVRLYAVLMAAMLVRDTGLLLIVAACLWAATQRRWKRAAWFLTAALPALAWYVFVVAHVAATRPGLAIVPRWFFRYPLVGIVVKLFRPERYPFSASLNLTLQFLDAVALCGMLLALGIVLWNLRRRTFGFEHWTALLFVVLAASTSVPSFWATVYNYGRPYSPLVLLAPLLALPRIPNWAFAPLLLLDVRIAVQVAPQALGIARGLLPF